MATSKLNKQLWTDITRLKALNAATEPKFILDKSPFNDTDQDEGGASATPKDILILGRILPDSEIYRDGAYQIEMKLTSTFPFDPPEVRFITKIYHPNVAEDGKKIKNWNFYLKKNGVCLGQFCHELLKKTAKWSNKTSLVDVIKAVAEHIDNPDIDYSLSLR